MGKLDAAVHFTGTKLI